MRCRAVGSACALLLAAAGASGQSPEELFRQGNAAYQAEAFDEALERYQAILAAGYESAPVYYNLGNTYFKLGDLGRATLNYERARRLDPRDPDIQANLELTRSLATDEIEPLPAFWFVRVFEWWLYLLPRNGLTVLVLAAWLAGAVGLASRIALRHPAAATWGGRVAMGAAGLLAIFGPTLIIREFEIGRPTEAIVLADQVPVQSAPSPGEDLRLFTIHEGTRVRVDQRTGEWAEIVLLDGKVGWVRADAFEEI